MKVNPVIMDECAICYGNYNSKYVVKHDCNAGIVCINCLLLLSEEQRNKCIVCRQETDIFNKKYLKLKNNEKEKIRRLNRTSITINIVESSETSSYNYEGSRYNVYRSVVRCCCKYINFDNISFVVCAFFLLLIGGWIMDVLFTLHLFKNSETILELIGNYVLLGCYFWTFIYATSCCCSGLFERENPRRINISIV